MKSPMVRIDLLTAITGYPVCLATRSAVRCLVPASSVGRAGSGMRCAAARTMLPAASSRTIAPSIFASSRSRVAENGTLSSNPPEQIPSTTWS